MDLRKHLGRHFAVYRIPLEPFGCGHLGVCVSEVPVFLIPASGSAAGEGDGGDAEMNNWELWDRLAVIVSKEQQ